MALHSQGGGIKGIGSAGQDTDGDIHILNSLRKIIDLDRPMLVRFHDKTHVRVDVHTAHIILEKYNALRTSIAKESMIDFIWKSLDNLLSCINRTFSPH